MYPNAQADLEALGCMPNDTASEIKLAYRLQARRLQRQLLEDWPGANERLALINAAYDRLKSLDCSAYNSSDAPQFKNEIAFCKQTLKRLEQILTLRQFKLSFELTRDTKTGVYHNPTRRSARLSGQMPTLLSSVAVTLSDNTIKLGLSAPPGVGLNIVAIPDIVVGRSQALAIGSEVSTISFFISRLCTRVRLDVSRLPFANSAIAECRLVYRDHSSDQFEEW